VEQANPGHAVVGHERTAEPDRESAQRPKGIEHHVLRHDVAVVALLAEVLARSIGTR